MARRTNKRRHDAAIAYLQESIWAMEPTVMQNLSAVLGRHLSGVKLSDEAIAAVVAGRDGDGTTDDLVENYYTQGTVGVIPVNGVIAKYASQVNGSSQPRGTSCEAIDAMITKAADDPNIRSVVFAIESPGGMVSGLPDLADRIASLASKKTTVACGIDITASAAYWLGSQCSGGLYCNQSANVGSIGVYTILIDSSQAASDMGLKVHLVKAGKFKGIGEDGVAIGAEQLKTIQERIDAVYDQFVGAVARGRDMDEADVRKLADGRVHYGQAAVDLGLADGVATLDQVVNHLNSQVQFAPGQKIQLEAEGKAEKTNAAAAAETGKGTDMKDKTTLRTAAATAQDGTCSCGRPLADGKCSECKLDPDQCTCTALNAVAPPTPPVAAVTAPAMATDAAGILAAERARVAEIDKALAGFPALRTQAMTQGLSLVDAKALAFDAAVAERDKALGDMGKVNAALAREGIEPVKLHIVDDNKLSAASGETADEFAKKVKAHAEAHKCTEAVAIMNICKSDPSGHQAWLMSKQYPTKKQY